MTESQATTKLISELKNHGHFWKSADRFRAGVPDIVGCYLGRFIGLEMKIDYGKPSAIQVYTLKDIVKNTGYAALITYSNKMNMWRMGSNDMHYTTNTFIPHLLDRMKHHEHDL